MKREITELKCEHCGKVVQSEAGRFGNDPFAGWVHVQRTPTFCLRFSAFKRELDFCSDECAVAELTKFVTAENERIAKLRKENGVD